MNKILIVIVATVTISLSCTSLYWWYKANKTQIELIQTKSDLSQVSTQLDAVITSNELLREAITKQNAAILRLGDSAQTWEDKFKELSKNSSKVSEDNKKLKEKIEGEVSPLTCEASIQYLRDAAKEMK